MTRLIKLANRFEQKHALVITAGPQAPGGLSSREYMELAMDCLDQAGLDLHEQKQVAAILAKHNDNYASSEEIG